MGFALSLFVISYLYTSFDEKSGYLDLIQRVPAGSGCLQAIEKYGVPKGVRTPLPQCKGEFHGTLTFLSVHSSVHKLMKHSVFI